MYASLLTAMLLGLFPTTSSLSADSIALDRVAIAPPSHMVELSNRVSASGVVIFDLKTGQQIFTKQAAVQRPMASLTKLMTALVIVENHDLDEVVTIPQAVADVGGNKAYLQPGDQFTVGELLSALLIISANDAAVTLAQFHSGSVPAFVATMNQRALSLGMRSTSFVNPTGFDHPAHWSTPQDIAWLTMFAYTKPEIAKRMAQRGGVISGHNGDGIQLYHTHALLHQDSPVIAGKTGTTSEAKQCLMSLIEVAGHEYLVVLLGSNQRYKDMEVILSSLNDASTIAVTAQVDY